MGNIRPIMSSFLCPSPAAPHGCSSSQAQAQPSPEPPQTRLSAEWPAPPCSWGCQGYRRQGPGEPRVAGLVNTSLAVNDHCCLGCLLCARCFVQVIHAPAAVRAAGPTLPQHTSYLPCWFLSAVWGDAALFLEGCWRAVLCPHPRNLYALPSFSNLLLVWFQGELPRCAPLGLACADRRVLAESAWRSWALSLLRGRGVGGRCQGTCWETLLCFLELGQGEPDVGSSFLSRGNASAPHCFFLLAPSVGKHSLMEPLQEVGRLSHPHLCVPLSPLPRA